MKSVNFLIIFFFILNISINAQTIPITFTDCIYDMFFVTARTTPEWKEINMNLTTYLTKKLQNYNTFKNVNGKILLGILIFENGKTCCHSFTNMTGTDLDPEVFKKIVNEMPDWKPAKQDGKPIIFLKHLVINIKDGEIISD